jgi:hypothetical protein
MPLLSTGTTTLTFFAVFDVFTSIFVSSIPPLLHSQSSRDFG